MTSDHHEPERCASCPSLEQLFAPVAVHRKGDDRILKSGASCVEMIDTAHQAMTRKTKRGRAAHMLRSGGRSIVLLRLDQTYLRRLFRLFSLRLRVASEKRMLLRAGADRCAVYGVFPRVDSLRLLYEVDTAAAAYAHTHLIYNGNKSGILRSLLFRVMTCIAGCDPSLGAVLVVGSVQ